MRYSGNVIRPPSEAESYILQITYGCSHNRCTFCGTYPDKPFSVRSSEEVFEDIETAGRVIPETRKVFLADGNAMVLSTSKLIAVLDELSRVLPKLRRVSIYANAQDLLNKSEDDLRLLRSKGLQIVYLGLESGSDTVLQRIDKGSTAAEMIQGVQRAQNAGIKVSVIALLGLGGPELSTEHAVETARVVNAMDPQYLSMLTLMLVPGTPLHEQWQNGEFEMMEAEPLLRELRHVIDHLDGLSRCIFRTNHASNYVPLAGTLSKDRERLLETLNAALDHGESAFRPEAWRGL